MKINKLLVVALLVGTTSFAQNLQSAIKNTDNELFTESEKELKALITKEPTNAANYYYLGENFYARKENDSALFYWNKAVSSDAVSHFGQISQGKIKLVSGDVVGAKDIFTNLITSTKNKNAEVLRHVAKSYLSTDTRNYDECISLLRRAIELEPKNEDNFLLLGDALLGKTPKDANEAIKNYNFVLDINPTSAKGLVKIGKIYTRAKADSSANSYFQQAQKLDPTYAPAYRENAELFLNANKPKRAIESWKKYLELNNSLEARYRYTTALFVGKQYCDVITEGTNLKQSGYTSFYVDRMLMSAYADCNPSDKENAAKGLAVADLFFASAPKDKINFLDYKSKGQLLVNAGKDSLAIAEYEKASATDEKAKKELAGTLAKSYLKIKNYPKAIENLEYKLANDKLNAAELYDLGKAYYVGPKNYLLADTTFAKLNITSPSYAPGFFWRGRASYQLDPKNEKWLALPYYQKAFEMVKLEDRALPANKSMVIESAKYVGEYYFKSPVKDLTKAKEYFKVVTDLDPNDPQAKAFFAIVK